MQVFGLDVGGSGIKGAPVDTQTGELLDERARVGTPDPATPEGIVEAAAEVVSRFGWNGPVGCGFPAVMKGGVAHTAANIDEQAVGFDFGGALEEALGCRVGLVNDADAAGLAEARWGAARDNNGLVLVLTVGTGIGTALISDGTLVPNTELGHIELGGRDAESYAADAARKRENLGWKEFAGRFNEYLGAMERLFWPDLIVIGGGASKKDEKFLRRLEARADIVPAEMLNTAGLAGAALAAADNIGAPA
ncbi:polyphosphate--glucose phosphotransferase [Rubrobacter aplysinae]|uniref:polyphosphate--glucose phosphotransferase n=1 Tax=Rubrobacter aplysinae TaxID=909625 RepID=UPI00064C46D3|nr:ROK family protein [Rubrobacter aplysinae]